MILCQVCSRLEPSKVAEGLEKAGFVVLKADDETRFVAVDRLGAKPESHVLVCRGQAAHAVMGGKAPVDAATVAIVD